MILTRFRIVFFVRVSCSFSFIHLFIFCHFEEYIFNLGWQYENYVNSTYLHWNRVAGERNSNLYNMKTRSLTIAIRYSEMKCIREPYGKCKNWPLVVLPLNKLPTFVETDGRKDGYSMHKNQNRPHTAGRIDYYYQCMLMLWSPFIVIIRLCFYEMLFDHYTISKRNYWKCMVLIGQISITSLSVRMFNFVHWTLIHWSDYFSAILHGLNRKIKSQWLIYNWNSFKSDHLLSAIIMFNVHTARSTNAYGILIVLA